MMKLSTSASAINMQADLKAAELKNIIYNDFTKPSKVWSKSVTAKHVLAFAEGLLKSIQERGSFISFQMRWIIFF